MVAMAYVLVLAIVALEIPLALSLRQRIDEEVKLQARNGANVVAVLANTAVERGDPDVMQELVAGPARESRGRIVIVDDNAQVIADSAGDDSLGSDLSSRPEIETALAGEVAQYNRTSTTLGVELLATAVPVTNDGKVTGAVRVTQDVAGETEAFGRAIAGLVAIGLAVLAVGLFAGAVIARQIARPLRRFEGAARAVADGDLEARAPVEGSSEQQELARTFNEMTDRLASSLKSQSRFVADASHQLRTPLTGLRLRLEEARAKNSDAAVGDEISHGIKEVDRLARTVEELLVLSQTGERDARAEHFTLSALVEDAAERWRPIADADQKTLGARLESTRTISASRADLDRVLDALIENAISYSPSNSSIELAAVDGSITVRDHGQGLAAGEGEEVFERFHRGNAGAARPDSTGLGLAIAKELAQRWGAYVAVANADGGGLLATIDFGTPTTQTGADQL